jgi:hypothetical protein
MALQLELSDSELGLYLPTAYVRITGIIFDSGLSRMEIQVSIYPTMAARNEGKAPVLRKTFITEIGYSPGLMDLETALPNGWRYAMYAWLKTQPYFAGAVDVIDELPEVPILVSVQLAMSPPSIRVALSHITLRDSPITVSLHSDTAEVVVPAAIVIGSGLLGGTVEFSILPVTQSKVATITITLDTVVHHIQVPLIP